MPPDKYQDFDSLSKKEREGIDFRICLTKKESAVAVIAPHGGKIEPGTSRIATVIAGDTFNLYCFEGLKKAHNKTLHITSHRFDEPKCLELLVGCKHVIAVHGLAGVGCCRF